MSKTGDLLSKETIDKLKGLDEWKAKMKCQQLKGKIEVTISVKTVDDLMMRLAQIAEQIISQSNDIYKVRYESLETDLTSTMQETEESG